MKHMLRREKKEEKEINVFVGSVRWSEELSFRTSQYYIMSGNT